MASLADALNHAANERNEQKVAEIVNREKRTMLAQEIADAFIEDNPHIWDIPGVKIHESSGVVILTAPHRELQIVCKGIEEFVLRDGFRGGFQTQVSEPPALIATGDTEINRHEMLLRVSAWLENHLGYRASV